MTILPQAFPGEILPRREHGVNQIDAAKAGVGKSRSRQSAFAGRNRLTRAYAGLK
jgi:hypothetical protein